MTENSLEEAIKKLRSNGYRVTGSKDLWVIDNDNEYPYTDDELIRAVDAVFRANS